MKFKTNIYELKKGMFYCGMGYSDLAKETGISLPYLSLIAKGERQPKAKNAKKISEAIQVPMEQLFILEEVEKDEATK